MSPPTQSTARTAVGCMSGTSLDGVDAAVLRVEGVGLSVRMTGILAGASASLGGGQVLARLAGGGAADASAIAGAMRELGRSCAEACRAACDRAGVSTPDLACVHGQTVHHAPPIGWQALDPWPVAAELGCPVAFDLRGADLGGGGQGAPITPLADWVLFRDAADDRLIVNLGGFCNATRLPAGAGPDGVVAGDLCACNQVLDAAARAALGRAFDADGAAAGAGRADAEASDALRAMLADQGRTGRSLGSGDEAGAWVDRWGGRLAGPDLLASACRGMAGAIADGLGRLGGGSVFLAGGSARNATLVRELSRSLGRPVAGTEALGVPGVWREAACFAVLGLLAWDGVEITLPRVTRRGGPIPLSGAWIFPPTTRGPSGPQTRRPTGRTF